MASMVWSKHPRDHVHTCFHSEPHYQLVREAEQVAVFHNTKSDQYHLSVRLGDWFHCQWFQGPTYRKMSDRDLMVYIQRALEDLKHRQDPSPHLWY